MTPADLWSELSIDEVQKIHHTTYGPLHVWLQRISGEVWIAHDYAQNLPAEFDPDTYVEHLTWERVAPRVSSAALQALPVFPDLPVVIGTEHRLKLAPGARIQIFSRIPVWVRFYQKQGSYTLTEIPTVTLSKTWFGSPQEGELCYWLTTKARRSLAEAEKKSYVVNCPITIINRSQEDLDFEKFCYRVERLGIYLIGEELWAGDTKITYHGEEQHSDITMLGNPPSEISGEPRRQLSAPRQPVTGSLATRTFRKLFEDTHLSAR